MRTMLNLLPRDEKYFDRFSDMARRIHESARILNSFFVGEAPVAPVADQIKRLEHECDEISHEVLRGIDRTFIPPIDLNVLLNTLSHYCESGHSDA